MTVLQSLINKQDSFEIIRDQIGVILVNEIANQKALAAAATPTPLDPKPWDMRIFIERSNPWEDYTGDEPVDDRPIVNVWYEGCEFAKGASNISERQKAEMVFNIDIYGYSSAYDTVPGHVSGDKQAALNVHRAVRLVRNILMAAPNTYLQFPQGFVWHRWIRGITMFQPTLENRAVERVQAARIAFQVEANEFSPQYEGQTLDYLHIEVKRAETGELYTTADFNYA